jgi:hypothetical protein
MRIDVDTLMHSKAVCCQRHGRLEAEVKECEEKAEKAAFCRRKGPTRQRGIRLRAGLARLTAFHLRAAGAF